MKCPHCQVAFHDNPSGLYIGQDKDGNWGVVHQICPACQKIILSLVCADQVQGTGVSFRYFRATKFSLAYPKGSTRPAPPTEVPQDYAADYVEASLVLSDSPKASAALTRRCLQHVLRNKAGVKSGDLYDEIGEAIPKLPSYLAESIDSVRAIGNFAAHPIKSKSTGEIVQVEPGEAENNLDVLDGLFDFYFVQPAITRRKKDALDAKLKEAGKPPTR